MVSFLSLTGRAKPRAAAAAENAAPPVRYELARQGNLATPDESTSLRRLAAQQQSAAPSSRSSQRTPDGYGSPSLRGSGLYPPSPTLGERVHEFAERLLVGARRMVTPSRARGRAEVQAEIAAREAAARAAFGATGQRPSRILLRDSYDHQSVGRWNIKRVGGDWFHMYADDWFNTIVHLPILRLLALMCALYVLCVFVFGVWYLSFSDECGMDFGDRLEAYYFSLETMATIGYGTQDYFFGHCWEPLAIINLQVVLGLVIESLYFGIIFHRLTRGRNRQSTVLFSDKACVRRVGASYYLVFQVCELRRHHLLDARIRVFAVRHERDAHGAAYYQAHRLQLRRPHDDSGGMLLMALPQLVVHKLDAESPLVPAETWMSARGPRSWAGLARDEERATTQRPGTSVSSAGARSSGYAFSSSGAVDAFAYAYGSTAAADAIVSLSLRERGARRAPSAPRGVARRSTTCRAQRNRASSSWWSSRTAR